MMREIAAIIFILTLCQGAFAGDKPALRHISCIVVRFYVDKYSAAAAETWARGHGATDAEIETARRCVNGSTVQTATWTGK
jgi:hypothetical protein